MTLSLPEEFDKIREKFREIDWNMVLKLAILKRLEELKKFEELKKKGKI